MKIQRTLGVLLLLAACQRELPLQETPEPVSAVRTTSRLQTVSMRLESDAADVKSVISVEAEDFRTAYLFAFDAVTGRVFLDEEGHNIGLKTESKTFNWTIPVGPDEGGNSQTMDVYAIVNPDPDNAAVLEGLLERTDVTEAELEALTYVCGDARSLSGLETDGMPMSGVRKGLTLESADEAFVLTIRRLFARYDIRLNVQPYAQAGWSVQAAEVIASHSNTRAAYFYTGGGVGVRASAQDLAMVDMATDSDLDRLNVMGDDGKSSGYLTLYFLENCQGDIGPANAWNSVWADLGSAVDCCSYAELAVKASHPNLGERCFKYRFYPGQNDDMCSNFDIIRNVRRKLSLTLSPDLSSEYFRWVYDGTLKVAPGEILSIPYQTTLEPQYLCFETYLDGLPDNYLSGQNMNDGRVTVVAAPDAPEGTVFQLKGGDASGQVSDKVNITVTSDVSYWKDVEILYTPPYRGQWMVVRLPENVFGPGKDLQATVYNYVQQDDGTYKSANASVCTIDLSLEYAAYGNGKTNIFKPHVWFDPSTRLLYVYSHATRPDRDNYSVLMLTVAETEGGEIYETQRREIVFRQREPVLRLKDSVDSARYVYQTYIQEENGYATTPPEMDFVLVDPENGNRVIPNEEFRWGGHGIYALGDNPFYFLQESGIEMDDIDESTGIEEQFRISWPPSVDIDAWDFNIYRLSVVPRVRASFAYGDNRYISFSHTFFNQGDPIHVHPTCELLAAPRRAITLMEAYGGTSRYADMRCSAQPAGDDFFLMHGFCQTYFVQLENLTGEPVASLSTPSTSAPYLTCSLTRQSATLYRLDCWITHYESPLDYNDSALPYGNRQTAADPADGDKDVTITVTSGAYSDQIVCHVLHKRFRVDLETVDGEDLRVSLWNPLGFDLEASCSFSADFSRYWYQHPLKELFDGPCFDRQSVSFSFSTSMGASPFLARNVSAKLEKGSQDLRGIRCTYARDVHPSFLEAGLTGEDLILYYPAAEAVSFTGNLQLSSRGFVSTVPGLSWREGTFNLEHYIAFSAQSMRFRYTLGTLSEYYLQTLFYEVTDIRYYGYRFATPTHWSECNPMVPFTLTTDDPMHIGGADSQKTVQGAILYKGANSFHAQDPVIGF